MMSAALGAFAGLAVGLPVAWVGLAKALILLALLGSLGRSPGRRQTSQVAASNGARRWRPLDVLVVSVVVIWACSMLWTVAPLPQAAHAWSKHAKLLLLLALPLLLRDATAVRAGLIGFALGQSIVLASSYLLLARVDLPWVTAPPNPLSPSTRYVVFSSYLDQGIMLATSAAVLWHLAPQRWRMPAGLWAVAALAHVLLVLEGRTAYAIAVALLCVALGWGLPGRARWLAWLSPIVMGTLVLLGSGQTHDRLQQVERETRDFFQHGDRDSSAGFRLHAWQTGLQAVRQHPWIGSGAGSWSYLAYRADHPDASTTAEVPPSNPHQEFLLWGVELGTGGALLLVALLLTMAWEALRYAVPARRATWSVLVALTLASLFNCALFDALIGDFFCILLGLLITLGRQTQSAADAT